MVQQLKHMLNVLCVLDDEVQFHIEFATNQLKVIKIKFINFISNGRFKYLLTKQILWVLHYTTSP